MRTKRAFDVKLKAFFIIFKGLSVAKNCLRPESSLLKYSIPKEIPVVFRNGSNHDCYFIIKELAEEFKKQFTCLRENIKKQITFQFQYKKKSQELVKKEK